MGRKLISKETADTLTDMAKYGCLVFCLFSLFVTIVFLHFGYPPQKELTMTLPVLRLTRSRDGKPILVNFNLVSCCFPLTIDGELITRICYPGSEDDYTNVKEPLGYISNKLNAPTQSSL